MKPDEIKKEVERLQALKEDAWVRWMDAKAEHGKLVLQIGEVINSCSVRRGPKHAGGGGGLGGRLWVVCEGCGHKHFWSARDPVEAEEWKALPGEVTYHSTGN